jgi:transcriptional regulator with XRE-family HTH domain
MELKRRIAIKLKTIRKSRKLTQDDLASLIGRSVDAISNIERSKGLPSLETLQAIASKLEIPIGDFFDSAVGKGRQSAKRLALEAHKFDPVGAFPRSCLPADRIAWQWRD